MSTQINKAHATFTILTNHRAIVDIEYKFIDGHSHSGFSTVDVMRSADLYDCCYTRAESLAETQGCRLETFKHSGARFTVYYINFGFAADRALDDLDSAIHYAESKGFEATINHNGRPVGSWSPITGFSDLTN